MNSKHTAICAAIIFLNIIFSAGITACADRPEYPNGYYNIGVCDYVYYVDDASDNLCLYDKNKSESIELMNKYIINLEEDEGKLYVVATDKTDGKTGLYVIDGSHPENGYTLIGDLKGDEMSIFSANEELLGTLSAAYESNGNPAAISSGIGDTGGASFGAYQFSSTYGVPKAFANWCISSGSGAEVGTRLLNAYSADGNACGNNFKAVWKEIAAENSKYFLSLQHDYVKAQYYSPAVELWQSSVSGFFADDYGIALKNVIWSRAVQHGVSGSKNVFVRAMDAVGGFDNQSEADMINAIYNESGRVVDSPVSEKSIPITNEEARQYGIYGKYMKYYSSNSSSVQFGVYKRLRIYELNDALKMSKTYLNPYFKSELTQNESDLQLDIAVRDVQNGAYVIVASYIQNKLADIKTEEFNGSSISVNVNKECDKAKIMLWENLSSMKPLTASKTVDILK